MLIISADALSCTNAVRAETRLHSRGGKLRYELAAVQLCEGRAGESAIRRFAPSDHDSILRRRGFARARG
jgi:hypothetical protein